MQVYTSTFFSKNLGVRAIICAAAFGVTLTLQACGGANAQSTPPPTDASVAATSAALENVKQGQAAVAAWRKAFKTGDYADLTALLDDNVEYRLGVAPYNTIRRGKADAITAFTAFQALQIRVDQAPIAPLMFSGSSTTFEFVASGTFGGNAVSGINLLVVFDIVNGKITRMREYVPPQ